MTDNKAVMQQALAALEAMQMEAAHRNCGLKIADDSIIALREAIAQPEQTDVSDADVKAAMDSMHFTSTGIPRVIDMRCVLEKFAKRQTIARPVCAECDGTRVVSDGQITHSEGGVRYENGPIVCMKDCPSCTAIAQPEQTDDTNALLLQLEVAIAAYQAWIAQPEQTPLKTVLHQMRLIGSLDWFTTDANGEEAVKRMQHWAGTYEFRTLYELAQPEQTIHDNCVACLLKANGLIYCSACKESHVSGPCNFRKRATPYNIAQPKDKP